MEPQNTSQPTFEPNTPNSNQPVAPLPPKRRSLAWLWITLASVGVLALIGAAVFWFGNAIFTAIENDVKNHPEVKSYTIGKQPYVYACSVAPASEYGRIFGLNISSKVGSVSEMGAVPPMQAGVTETDLMKLVPSGNGQYVSTCTNALSNQDGTKLKRLNVTLAQHPDSDEADRSFRGARSLASNFDKNQLPALPAYEKSFVKLPASNDPLHTTKASVLMGTFMVTLEYSYDPPQTNDSVTTMLNEYMQVIERGLAQEKITVPLNLTGHDTGVGEKVVDVCQSVNLQKVADIFGGIQWRPDEHTTAVTYGSIEGSRAAEDGASSDCKLTYNTSGDREAQATIDQSGDVPSEELANELTAASKWPHNLDISVNTFDSREKARAWLDASKTQAAKPASGVQPVVGTVSDLADGAYKVHKEDVQETSFNDETVTTTYLDDSYVILSDKNVVTISLQQVKEAADYQTVPLTPTQEQFRQVFDLVEKAVKDNR